MRWMPGRISSIRRMVNAPVTMRRNRACFGSSMNMKLLPLSRRACVLGLMFG